jgi:hypothetical protein
MGQNWWETAPLVDQRTASGPVVLGSPRPVTPPPQRPIDAALSAQQLENARLETEAKALANAKAKREAARPGGEDPNNSQGMALGFYSRAKKALDIYGEGVPPRSAVTQGLINILPSGIVREHTSDARKNADTAAAEFIAATLRKESGAAISPAEYASQYERYFPVPGDDDKQLAIKKQLREQALESIRIQAGSAAPPATLVAGDVQFHEEQPSVHGARLTEAQQADFERLLATKPTGAQINAFLSSAGLGPDPRADEKAAAIRRGAPASTGVDYSQIDAASVAAAQTRRAQEDALVKPSAPLSELLQTGVLLGLPDEVRGVGGAVEAAANGESVATGYATARDAERLRQEDARQKAGWAGTGAEVLGGLLSANPEAAIAPVVSRGALIRQGARAGGYGGAIAGFGYGNGLDDSASSALVGGALGAGIGGGISALASRGGGGNALRAAGADLRMAGERQGVQITAPHARPGVRNALAYLESSPGSSGVAQRSLARTGEQIETAAGNIAPAGTALTNDLAGDVVQGAGRRFIARSRGVATRLYNRAATLSRGATVQPRQALQVADGELAELAQNPNTNQAEINFLNEVRSDLAQPNMTVDAIRNLRTSLRGRISQQNLTQSSAEARATRIIDAATQDIVASVPPEAARAYQRADEFYRQRMNHIQDVVQKFTGPRNNPLSGEKAFARLQSMASPRGDAARLARMVNTLEPGERADVAATIAEQLGRRQPDEPFSPALFVSQASRLSAPARRTIFGPDGAAAVEDLLQLARAQRDVTGRLNNSRSGQVLNYAKTVGSMVLGGAGGAAVAGTTGGAVGAIALPAAGMVANNISARLLLSRPFARWLTRAPRTTNPAAIQAHIRQLGGLGRNTPIAADIQSLQQALQRQFAPAAASGGEQEKDK